MGSSSALFARSVVRVTEQPKPVTQPQQQGLSPEKYAQHLDTLRAFLAQAKPGEAITLALNFSIALKVQQAEAPPLHNFSPAAAG